MPLPDPAVIRMPLHARLTPPAAVRMNFLRDADAISILLKSFQGGAAWNRQI
jgi:predicted RNA-binding protein with PUA domain